MPRLFLEGGDEVVAIDLNNSEMATLTKRNRNGANGKIGAMFDMGRDHVAIIHLVDMVSRQDQHIFGVGLLDAVDVLVDGIGGSFVPMFVDALLRRKDLRIFVELPTQETPSGGNVAVEAASLVLLQH